LTNSTGARFMSRNQGRGVGAQGVQVRMRHRSRRFWVRAGHYKRKIRYLNRGGLNRSIRN